ncbi:hypothetical protein JQN72_04760 [Phycicoccus sp. CSK15P-2]|uniref:hypothetical protein n=1 Tax=Phycicoccus sp. CSK15P-2 TaxID=2807627 RepID=UPI00194F44E9|nr:hypothetical protein [Phycicoccus sp. CSK15P-2]MBM6403554.1 hypothetical protein [Phycicoccus sp. CSK15P-2]
MAAVGSVVLELLAGEVRLLRAVWLVARRRVHVRSGDDVPLPYARGGAVLALVLAGVSLVELVAVHLLVPWERFGSLAGVRWVVLGVSAYTLLWVLGWWAALHAYPHLAGADSLVLRQGPWTVLEVPWAHLAGAERVQRLTPPEDRHTIGLPGQGLDLDLALDPSARPRRAVTGREGPPVDAVSLAVDDPRHALEVIRSRGPARPVR